MDGEHYCREVESYLCSKNDGHLIRIVGPSFELVCRWAYQKVPLSVVRRAIDKTFERYYAKGNQRRPVQIKFCEADVMELFNEWRRAVGVADTERIKSDSDNQSSNKRLSLAAHIDRLLSKLRACQDNANCPNDLAVYIKELINEFKAVRVLARTARGANRKQLELWLGEVEHNLVTVARGVSDQTLIISLRTESELELEPFRVRMPADAFEGAVQASIDKLLRDYFRLPKISYD